MSVIQGTFIYPPLPLPLDLISLAKEKKKKEYRVDSGRGGIEYFFLLQSVTASLGHVAFAFLHSIPSRLSQENRGSPRLVGFIERPWFGSPGKACQQVVAFSEVAVPLSPRCSQLLFWKKRWKDCGVGAEALRAGTHVLSS